MSRVRSPGALGGLVSWLHLLCALAAEVKTLNCSHQAGLCSTAVYAPSSSCIAAETQPQVVFHEEMSGVCPVVSSSWGKLSAWARQKRCPGCCVWRYPGFWEKGAGRANGKEELFLVKAVVCCSLKCLRGWW